MRKAAERQFCELREAPECQFAGQLTGSREAAHYLPHFNVQKVWDNYLLTFERGSHTVGRITACPQEVVDNH